MSQRSSGACLLCLIVGWAIVGCAVVGWALPAPACGQESDQEKFVVIKAGRVITMAGPELTDVDILLVDGKVRLVGQALSYPKSAQVIDARGQLVMPGMIHPQTRWQLPSYSRDGVHGDRSAAKEIFLEELDVEPLLQAGFTVACFVPGGTGMPGSSAVYRLAGPDSLRALGESYLRVTMSSPGRDKKTFRDAVKKARQEIEKVDKARKDWEEKQKQSKDEAAEKEQAGTEEKKQPQPEPKKEPAKETGAPADEGEKPKEEKKDEQAGEAGKSEEFKPPPIDPTVLPLVNWIRDEKGSPLLYELSSAADYLHLRDVLAQAKELPSSMVSISNSTRSDMQYVVSQLGEQKAVVLLPTGIGTLPYTATQYNLAADLILAGCKIVLQPPSDSATVVKEFRLQLADLVRAGVPRDEALKAVTLRAAELLGIEKQFGSIEKGKDADFIFLDGDPLHPDTKVLRVMSAGEIVWEAQ